MENLLQRMNDNRPGLLHEWLATDSQRKFDYALHTVLFKFENETLLRYCVFPNIMAASRWLEIELLGGWLDGRQLERGVLRV